MNIEEQQTAKPRMWKRAGLVTIVLVALFAGGAVNYFKNAMTDQPDEGVKQYSGNLVIDRALAVRDLPTYREHSNGWCDGDESICTTLTTTAPADSLQGLIAAIPKGEAKHYKVRLSVTPIEEFEEPEEVHAVPSAAPKMIDPPSTPSTN